jgi:hypothetical protein
MPTSDIDDMRGVQLELTDDMGGVWLLLATDMA